MQLAQNTTNTIYFIKCIYESLPKIDEMVAIQEENVLPPPPSSYKYSTYRICKNDEICGYSDDLLPSESKFQSLQCLNLLRLACMFDWNR